MSASAYSLRVGKCVAGIAGVAVLAVACAVPTVGSGEERTGETTEATTVSRGFGGNLGQETQTPQPLWTETGITNPWGVGVCLTNPIPTPAGLAGCTEGYEYYSSNGDEDDLSYAFACPVGTAVPYGLGLPILNDPYVDPFVRAWHEQVYVYPAIDATRCFGGPDQGWEIVIDRVTSLMIIDPGCAGSECNNPQNPPVVVHDPNLIF